MLLTGDVKHDVFIDGENMGVSVIDAGHFYTEISSASLSLVS